MNIGEEIMEMLKRREKEEYDRYINPHVLTTLGEILEEFYGLEDDGVDEWTSSMWGQ